MNTQEQFGFEYDDDWGDYSDDWWDAGPNPELACVVCGDTAHDHCARCGGPLCMMHHETRVGFCQLDWCENDPAITRDFLMAMGDWNPSALERLRWALYDWWHMQVLPWWRQRFISQTILRNDDGDIPF